MKGKTWKKHGKVVSIPVKEVTEGMCVIFDTRILKVVSDEIFDDSENHIYLHTAKKYISELKTLVVEHYTGNVLGGNSMLHNNPVIKQIPLKYSQWQAALDNGEVDSDKVVEFEIKYFKSLEDAEYGEEPEAFAKIIPQKETWDDIVDKYVEYRDTLLAKWAERNKPDF